MRTLIFICLVLVCLPGFPQEGKKQTINVDKDFNLLLHYKRENEKYNERFKKDPQSTAKHNLKRDSLYKLYVDKAKSIRESPEIYLTHINRAIRNNRVDNDSGYKVPYDYFNTAVPVDFDIHTITKLDLYKIIKRDLFEKKKKLLEERTPLYIERDGKENIPQPILPKKSTPRK